MMKAGSGMAEVFDCSDAGQRQAGIASAISALKGGRLVVLPTDTVYGIAVRAELPGATARLFSLKDRAEVQPVAVLVAAPTGALQTAAVSAGLSSYHPDDRP